MKPRQIGVLALAALAIGVGFVALRPSKDDKDVKPSATTQAKLSEAKAKAEAARAGESAGKDEKTGAGSSSDGVEISDAPVLEAGKMKTITVRKGEDVQFSAASEVPEEVHVHGYDIARDIPAGGTVDVSFKATQTGVFEIEFHKVDKQVAKLKVMP